MSDVAVAADVPASRTVLTSESAPAFYAKRLDLVEPAPAEASKPDTAKAAEGEEGKAAAVESPDETKDAKDGGKEAVEQQDEADHPDPEKKQKLNLRFSELTQRIKDAEAKATAEAEARALAERKAAELQAKYEPPKTDELGPKPTRAQFSTDQDFELALEDWAGEKAVKERDFQQAEAQRVASWKERQAATRAELPDYDAVIAAGGNLEVSGEVREAILESDVGPKILHHLAKNPDLVADLKKKSVAGALLVIGRLDAEFAKAKPASGEGKPAPAKAAAAATEVSRAPAPITPLKGAGSAVAGASVNSQGEFIGTYADYKAQRAAGKIK